MVPVTRWRSRCSGVTELGVSTVRAVGIVIIESARWQPDEEGESQRSAGIMIGGPGRIRLGLRNRRDLRVQAESHGRAGGAT